MNDDDDFAISSSFKQANASKTDPFGASKKSAGKETSAAKERLNRIIEEEKKQAREAKLKEIMRQQKAELKAKMGDSDDDDDEDDEFERDSDDSEKAKKGGKVD